MMLSIPTELWRESCAWIICGEGHVHTVVGVDFAMLMFWLEKRTPSIYNYSYYYNTTTTTGECIFGGMTPAGNPYE